MVISISSKQDTRHLEYAEPGSVFFYKQSDVLPHMHKNGYDAGIVVDKNAPLWMKILWEAGFAGALRRVYASITEEAIVSANERCLGDAYRLRLLENAEKIENEMTSSFFPSCDWKPRTKELIVAMMPVQDDVRARSFAEGLERLLEGRK